MDKFTFLAAYRAAIINAYAWATDTAKFDRFMRSVEVTITTTEATWIHDSPVVTAVWKSLGGKGKPTLKALRSLPAGVRIDEDETGERGVTP